MNQLMSLKFAFKLAILLFFISGYNYCQKVTGNLNHKKKSNEVWTPDNGNGTYKNPIIFADYSDPDVIRVGDDFFMTSSSFIHTPGLPILHSKDLVNWKIVNHVFANIPYGNFVKPMHGNGIWAPSIRYHNGEFFIYYGDPDYGIFMSKTKNPFGKWQPLVLVKKSKGWIDPCPLWDDDGNAYLVHAWAKSRSGIKSKLTVNKLSPDGTKILDDGVFVFDGTKDHPTIEGPKFYKRNGYYYIFAPAGGVPTGWQTVLRSKNIYGPYENKIVLHQGTTKINGPHQGGWVETQTGEDWFIHFQDRDAYGRIVHLQPMKWINDWPIIGIDKNKNGIGEPVLVFKKPNVGKIFPIQVPQTSDEFNSEKLGLQWQWEANHNEKWYSLSAVKGKLRLFSQPFETDSTNIYDLPNVLGQKFPAEKFVLTTKLEFEPKTIDERTGLVILGMDYAALFVAKTDDGLKLFQSVCFHADQNGNEKIIESRTIDKYSIVLRVSVFEGAVCSFSFSLDGKTFSPIGKNFIARKGKWVGAKVGLFASAPKKNITTGYADYDWFRFTK